MEIRYLQDISNRYNPWWLNGEMGDVTPPYFRRPIFRKLYEDTVENDLIVSLIGPRRVGKTTLMRQIIQELLKDGYPADRILYFSMDHPVIAAADKIEVWKELILNRLNHDKRKLYVFLDEIHHFERWETFLKSEVDINAPVKFFVSGSASTTVFRKSLESLIGRVIDRHIGPWSFYEWFYLMVSVGEPVEDLGSEFTPFFNMVEKIKRGEFTEDDLISDTFYYLKYQSDENTDKHITFDIPEILRTYFVLGGFPELMFMRQVDKKSGPEEQLEFVKTNYIDKVIREDLALTRNIRHSTALESFLFYLFTNFGTELNLSKLSKEMGPAYKTLSDYLDLIIATDLVFILPKYYPKMKTKQGNRKIYIADPSLRNALLKIPAYDDIDQSDRGFYAENLVMNVIRNWPEITKMSYYRDSKGREIDFIIEISRIPLLPIEVKYKNNISGGELTNLEWFINQKKCPYGLLVKKDGPISFDKEKKIISIALHDFLLIFDAYRLN